MRCGSPCEGFVYAATGEKYNYLANQSALSLKEHNRDAIVHLFTDKAPNDNCFDKIHILSDAGSKRPKFESLRLSEFENTIYIDSDTMICTSISDIFFLLERFDIAGSHVFLRNSNHCRKTHKIPFPNSFPQINTGVLAIRKSEKTRAFLAAVEDEMRAENAKIDQPIFRELLWFSDLRIATLPPEYNFKQINKIPELSFSDCAPRILHDSELHRNFDPEKKSSDYIRDSLGRTRYQHLSDLIESDKFINPEGNKRVKSAIKLRRKPMRALLHRLFTR